MTDAPVDQANEDEQVGSVLAGLAQPRSSIAPGDGEQADSGPDSNEPVSPALRHQVSSLTNTKVDHSLLSV